MASTPLEHRSGCQCIACLHQYARWDPTRATDLTALDAVTAYVARLRGVRAASVPENVADMNLNTGGATIISADGKHRVSVTTRASTDGAHYPVVDILRPGHGSLCVCLNCGVTWSEGGQTGQRCQPCEHPRQVTPEGKYTWARCLDCNEVFRVEDPDLNG